MTNPPPIEPVAPPSVLPPQLDGQTPDSSKPALFLSVSRDAELSQPRANRSPAALISPAANNAGLGFNELMAADSAPPVYVLSDFLHEGHVAVFGGAFGQGKTFLWLQISIHAAVGRPILGMNITRPYRVLFLDTENGQTEIKNRLQRYVPSMALSPLEHALLNKNWKYIDFQDEGPLYLLDLAKPNASPRCRTTFGSTTRLS